MSPKSRGRRTPGNRRSALPAVGRSARLPDVALRSARSLTSEVDLLGAHRWASAWLGQAWAAAARGDRLPEKAFVRELTDRALAQPSAQGLAALEALRLAAPPEARPGLDQAVTRLRRSQPRPAWAAAPAWTVTDAWRGTDVWDSLSIVFLEVDGDAPFTLFAPVDYVGGGRVATIRVLDPGAAQTWTADRGPDDVPLSVVRHPAAEALTELADALRTTDHTWPKTQDEGYVRLRGLAWSLARDHLAKFADVQDLTGLDDAGRATLLDAFFAGTATVADTAANRGAADICLDYGDLAFHGGPTAWSPHYVEPFLLEHLTRKIVLDADAAAALPGLLPAWITFCLHRRGVDQRWIEPVLDVVEDCIPDFRQAVSGRGSLVLGSQLLADLEERGVDLEDRQQVEEAVRALNAESLARALLES